MKIFKIRVSKIILYTVGLLIFLIIAVVILILVQTRSAIIALNSNKITPQGFQVVSPFTNTFKENSATNLNVHRYQNKGKNSEAVSELLDRKTNQKSQFSLEGFNFILNSELGPFHLCDVECKDLNKMIFRLKNYNKGNIHDDYEKDLAFQLAIRMNQAAFGPAGKEVLSMIHQMQNDSVSFKSIITLSALLWHVEKLQKK